MRAFLLIGAVFALGCAHGPSFMPTNRDAALRRAERIGQKLFEADAAAARGTDALLAATRSKLPEGVTGYVVVPERHEVVFLGKNTGTGPLRLAVVQLEGTTPLVTTTEEPATSAEAQMFAALATARRQFSPTCDRTYNAIVISDPDEPNWLVYFLAATADPREVVTAGHVRAVVSKSDGKLVEITPLSRTCLTSHRTGPNGEQVVMSVLSHPLGALPTEGHVYTSLASGLPLAILADDFSMWKVEAGAITPLK